MYEVLLLLEIFVRYIFQLIRLNYLIFKVKYIFNLFY